MYIGYLGAVIFGVAERYLVTPDEVERTGSARWQVHDTILKKPVPQFVGPGQEQVSFKLHLMSEYNANPKRQLARLREMRDNGIVCPLIIRGEPVSQNYWYVESVDEADAIYDAYGEIVAITANVTLKEYDTANTDEESELNKMGKKYNKITTILGRSIL